MIIKINLITYLSTISFSPTNRLLRKFSNNGLENSCPKIRLKPMSVNGLMNFAIEIHGLECHTYSSAKIYNFCDTSKEIYEIVKNEMIRLSYHSPYFIFSPKHSQELTLWNFNITIWIQQDLHNDFLHISVLILHHFYALIDTNVWLVIIRLAIIASNMINCIEHRRKEIQLYL